MTWPRLRFGAVRTFLFCLVFLGVPCLLVSHAVEIPANLAWSVGVPLFLAFVFILAALDHGEEWIEKHQDRVLTQNFEWSTTMQFRNVTEADLENAAKTARVRLVGLSTDGPGFRARIGLDPASKLADGLPRWQKVSIRSDSVRNVGAVCWHGHLYFLACLFLSKPDAIVKGGRESTFKYDGAQDFLDRYEETGDWNVGSQVFPVNFRDSCLCAHRQGGWDEQAEIKATALRRKEGRHA